MKKLRAVITTLASFGFTCGAALGQASFSVPNAGTTGTTLNSLATIGTSYTAVIATTSSTTVPTYVVAAGAGTSGVAVLAFGGQALCTFDATNASGAGGWYVVASTTTGGDCHAQSTAPANGVWVVGFLNSASTSSGSTALLNVMGGFYNASTGAIAPSSIAGTGPVSGQSVNLCADTSASGTAQSCTTTQATFTVTTGSCVTYTTTTTNSGTGLTVNVNSLGAKSIAIPGSSGFTTILTAGIIPANKPQILCYDGTNWDDAQTGTASNGGGGSPGGSNQQAQYNNNGAFGGSSVLTMPSGASVIETEAGPTTNTTLSAGITGTATTATLTSGTGYPASGYALMGNSGSYNVELASWTLSGSTITFTARGICNGGTGTAQSTGSLFELVQFAILDQSAPNSDCVAYLHQWRGGALVNTELANLATPYVPSGFTYSASNPGGFEGNEFTIYGAGSAGMGQDSAVSGATQLSAIWDVDYDGFQSVLPQSVNNMGTTVAPTSPNVTVTGTKQTALATITVPSGTECSKTNGTCEVKFLGVAPNTTTGGNIANAVTGASRLVCTYVQANTLWYCGD